MLLTPMLHKCLSLSSTNHPQKEGQEAEVVGVQQQHQQQQEEHQY
jgi:hypothetical protein